MLIMILQLLTQDMSLVTAISTACPSSEVEELTVSLLNIFESRGQTFELMEALIKQEIEDTGAWRAHPLHRTTC